MNTKRFACAVLAIGVTVCSLSSCSLEHLTTFLQRPHSGAPLQHGVKYEVRTALVAGAPFKPAHMKQYYFVLEEARPPLLAARGTASRVVTVSDSQPRVSNPRSRVTWVKAKVAAVNNGAKPDLLRVAKVAPKIVVGTGTRLNVRTTAYCHDESDHIVYGRLTALGTRLKYGAVRSAAADWSRYPVGTRFRISGQPDVIYEVDDYGSALVGTGTIDLYHPTRKAMNNWGVRNVDIEVVEWGSFEESVSIMSERSRWPHVRRMLNDIQTRVSEVTADTVAPSESLAL